MYPGYPSRWTLPLLWPSISMDLGAIPPVPTLLSSSLWARACSTSFKQAVDQWLSAGWPAEKLVAGTPFYGRSVIATQDMTKDPSNMYVHQRRDGIPKGDQDDATWYDACSGVNSMSGVWQYANLRKQGVLTSPEVAGNGWFRAFDEASQTPWVYKQDTGAFISYDDPKSLTVKTQYAKEKGLKGMMTWSLNGDYQDELLDALSTIGPLCTRGGY